MLLQRKCFQINEFKIPDFTLSKGQMLRFWVEIIPRLENDTNGYWVAKKVQKTIKVINRNSLKIGTCSNKINRGFMDIFNPISTSKYLKKKFKLCDKKIEELLSYFEIKSEDKIKNLGVAHQKVFSIICGFQKYQIISFDYYGLSPTTEEQLTKFVKNEVKKGKSAISFDNLHYKPESYDTENIINLEIRRKAL